MEIRSFPRNDCSSPLLTVSFPGLCQRRQWPEPHYQSYLTEYGIRCVVRVNNREYHTDLGFENEILAFENAAQRAYLICRNFSVNDGMLPGSKGTSKQGKPVAIGHERRSILSDDGSISIGSSSGGSSPDREEFFPPLYPDVEPPRRTTGRKQSYRGGQQLRR